MQITTESVWPETVPTLLGLYPGHSLERNGIRAVSQRSLYLHFNGRRAIIGVYVNDFVNAGESTPKIGEIKTELA